VGKDAFFQKHPLSGLTFSQKTDLSGLTFSLTFAKNSVGMGQGAPCKASTCL
jgi:hypothetical protein